MTDEPIRLTGRQLRDARGLLGLPLREMAGRLEVDPDRLARAEAMYGAPAWHEADAARVRAVLEAAGVEFLPPGPAGQGTRLRRP